MSQVEDAARRSLNTFENALNELLNVVRRPPSNGQGELLLPTAHLLTEPAESVSKSTLSDLWINEELPQWEEWVDRLADLSLKLLNWEAYESLHRAAVSELDEKIEYRIYRPGWNENDTGQVMTNIDCHQDALALWCESAFNFFEDLAMRAGELGDINPSWSGQDLADFLSATEHQYHWIRNGHWYQQLSKGLAREISRMILLLGNGWQLEREIGLANGPSEEADDKLSGVEPRKQTVDDPKKSTPGRNDAEDALPKRMRKDEPSRIKAKSAYDYAMERIPNANMMTAAELFDAITKDGEAKDMLPPSAETLTRYLNDCGIRLRKCDAKAPGGAVVRKSDI